MSPSLLARALKLLARREYSRHELQQRLSVHSDNPSEIEAVLDELAERGWQSDERYAQSLIRSKSPRHGRLKIAHQLEQHGIDARDWLPEADDEQQRAIAILQRKYATAPETWAEKQKAARFLAQRGFDTDTIFRAIKIAWQNDEQME